MFEFINILKKYNFNEQFVTIKNWNNNNKKEHKKESYV